MRKYGILLGIVAFAISYLWLADILRDRENYLQVTSKVIVYSTWDCWRSEYGLCESVYELEPGKRYDVYRIRFGKDFMAIKVKPNGVTGWVVLDESIKLVAKNT